MKTGLLLEGGAMRGLYTAGALDVFMEKELPVDGIVGVSAGALFGMNYKSKQSGRVLRYNKKYANDKRYMGMHSLLTTGNIMNEEFCFHRLVNALDPVDFETYRNSKEVFYAVVTNMETGRAEYHRLDDLEQPDQLEYLRASGSMPFVSKPVVVHGKKYLDGGVADSIPIRQIMKMGYDKVIVILTRPENYRKKRSNQLAPQIVYRSYPKLVDAINHRYQNYNDSLDEILRLEKERRIFVLRPSRQVSIRRIEKDLDKIQEMYELGRADAQTKMTELEQYLQDPRS